MSFRSRRGGTGSSVITARKVATDFSQLQVTGTASLGGRLNLDPLPGLDPAVGEQFDVVSAANVNGSFSQVSGVYIDATRRLTPMTTATQMALEVTAVDQAALAQQLRSQWNAGVTALLAALPDWAAALDTHGEDLLVLPDAVAGALGVDSLLTSWATANLKTIDEATSLNTLTDLRTALQNLGYGSACVLGDAACDRNLLAVPIVASLSDQGTSIPYDDTMNSQLTGLAPGAALAADLNPSLDLSFDWNLGVDETAFYLEPLTIFDASITSADPMTGQSPLPGGAFSLLAQPTSQVTADLHLALAAAGAPVRLRAAQFSDPTTTFQSTATASAEIALDWSLQLDGGDTGYTFTDAWMLSSADGTVTVTDNLAPVSGDVLLSSLTSRLSDTLDQYFQPELLDKIGELVLPFTGSLEAKSVTTSRAVADHDASGDSIWMDRFVGWLRGLVDVPQGGQGLFATEGDQWLEADRLRHRAGVSGAGIKIAVISDGIATSGAEPTTWTALNRAITTGDLPALRTDESQPGPWVDVRRAGFGSGGIGMMEIIHDVAPDAQLLFWGIDAPFETNDAEDKQVLFIEGAKALIAAGADVIVDDYSFLNDTWFQDSWFTAQLRELLETHGVTWITSAGDDRLNHFQETMAPDSTAMGDLHIIDPGNDVDGRFVLQVQASTSGNHRLSLQWNDSFYDPQNRLVLHRVDYAPATKTITGTVATSEAQPSASAELFFSLDQGETAYFVVELAQQAKPDVLPEFEIFGDRGLVFQVDPTQRGDALVSHKSLPHVLVVGAMDIAQPNQVSPTSNAGPSTRRGQTPVPSLDVLGVSGVKVSGAGGASRRFDGTGAAAAHVAAVSGLLMELLEKDGRPQTQWRALITDALTGSAQTFSGEDYTDEEGYGLINAVRAADRLGLLPPDDGSQPLLPPRVPTSSALGLIGIDVQMTSDDALRAFLSGDATQLSNDQLVTLSFTVPEHAFAPLSAEFDFSLGKDTLGALDQFGLEGTVRGTFLPEALVQFGLDTAGSYLDSATHIGGRVVVEPAARGRHFSSTVQLVGNIQARPVLTFDPGAGRMRLGDVGEHLANDVRLALDPVAAGEPATITGTVDADLVLGFLDYVDVDPRLPNTAHGGDPFRIRGSAGLGIELTDLSASSLANVQFTWGQLDLKNPDVDEDGVQDYTAGVFLANALEAGYALIDGIGLADYLSGLASGFGESVSQVMATVTKPRGALPEDIPPTADAERARTMIRQRIEEGAADANDSGILQAMAEWLSGSGDPDDTNLSVKERINRLDPGSPDFDGNQTWGEFRDSLIAALGDWELFNRTLSALWGGRDTAPSQQVSLLDQLRLSVADAIAEAIRRAHDDAIAIFHANPRGPARDGGDGYLDRAYDMVQWATTADFFNLTDVRTDISPRYVMEHLPLRVVIVNEETSLVAQTEDGLLGKDDEALFRAKAGIQFKHTGVPINADPKAPDYDSKFGAPVFDTQQVVIRARGRDNSNRVSGAPATENSTLDQLLELVGLPGIDWFDSERNDGSVELTTDATGVVRTSVHLGENDTLAQVEFTAGIKELPLAESRTEVVLGRPHVELEGGVAGNDSVSDSPPLVGPQQSVLLRARVVRGRGPLADAPVTFYLLNEDLGSLTPSGAATRVRVGARTSPDGYTFAEYFPPAGAVDTAVLGAVYFEKGHAYTDNLNFQVVTDEANYATASGTVSPAVSPNAASADADAVRAERERLIVQSGGVVHPGDLVGLQPLLVEWYNGAVTGSIQEAQTASEAYQNLGNVSIEARMQTYKAAERATDDAGTELLEWLGNVTLLGEHLTADLIAKRDAAGSQYGSLLQDAIERNLDFFRRLQPEMNARAFGDEQLSDWFGEPLLGTRPLVEALRWRVTADSMAPMVATVLATSESGRQTPWSKGDILAEAGLRTRWDDGPHVSPLSTQSPSIAISGRPILEVVTPGPGTNEAAQVWIKPGIPAPLTVELSSPSGIEIEQASFSVGSTMEFDEGTGAYEPRIAAADFATSATAGATLGSVDVDFITLFAGVELDRVRVTRVAPPSLTLRGRLGDQPPSTLALGSVKSDQASVVLRVDLSRRGEVVAGAPVSYRLIGAGTLSSGETETDENGVARVVYTPPNATPDMPVDSNGVALVIASYTENGALFSKMLTLVYQPRENSGGSGDATGSGFDTPDQEQAAADLADLIAAHTTTDSLGVQTVDWDAIRGPAKQILSQWWGTPDDYQTLGAGHAVGSVLYWLEAVTHLPPDLQWNENADEQDAVFRQTLQNALGNWAQWFAAAKALEIAPSSVPGFNALAGDERIIAALNTAIARTHDRCVARADEYKAAPSGTEQQREYRVELLRRLVQEGEEALEYYTAGRILEVFKRAPSTLEEIRDALCYIPEISTSRDETFLKPNGTSTTSAKFQMRAGIRVEGVEELLFVEGLTVAVTPVGGSSTDLITGATDADGYFRHTIPMDTREEVIEVDAVVSWNASTIAEQGSFITFAEQRVLLEGAPVMDIRVAKVSDGPGALSTTAPTLVDGEELLVELRLTRGPAPAAHQTVFTAIHGPAAETELFYVTNESGIVRFVVSPNVKQTGDIVIAFAYRDQDGVRSRSIRVPHQSTDDGAATVTAFSAAQTEAEARVGEIVGQAVIDLGPMAEFDFDLNIDPQLLKAPQEYWLNAGLAGPDEPVGLQKRVDELSIDTLETTLTEYARWRAANEFLGVDELFPQGPLEDTLRTKYRQVVEALIQLIWDPDPNRVGEAPSADGARRLLRWAAQAEHMGFDRSDINDESYSFNAILSRLGYELKIDEVLLDGPATNALLTVNANYYLWDADPGAGGTGTGKVQAATMSGHPVVVDVVPFNGMLSEQDGELKRLAPNGHYVNGIRLGPNATELVVDVLASDSEYGTIYDWRRKIKLPAEYRFDGAAKKASENDNAWSKELSVSSHVDTPEQAVIRGELYQGTGRLTGQQVTAELAAPAKGTLQRDGQQGDRFLYTPPPGEDGSQTIQLTTIIAGERQSTEITITYENTPAGTVGQTGDDSLWGWITRQFDSLTTPLGDGDAAGSGVGSSFGMEDIQFPSLGGSFNRAAGYAGGLLDAAIGAFDVVDTISLSEVLDWLQNGPPAETKNLIEFSFDLNAISAILSPTLLAADFTDLLPEGFSGTASVDRPELTGQIVFGLDSSNDSFYIRTRPDRTAKSEPQQRPVTDMGARFGIAAHIDAQLELFDGILTLEHGEGYLTTKVQADWSHVAPADGKLRLSHLDQLQHLQVGFDGNPLDSFQLMLAANAKIPGVSEAGSGATDPSLSLPLAGAVFKPSLDTIAPADRPPEGADLPTVFELRTGTLDLNIDPQLAEALKTQTITVNGQEKDDVHEFLGDYHQLLVGGPGDLGIPNQKLTVVPLALRDAADWFRFEITSRGTPTSYVQVDFARQRGDLDLELYRETVDSATGGRSVVFVRGDALAFGDRARVSLLGQPAGVYYLRVSDDAGGRNPYYSITIQPPKPVDTGVTAEIEGFELRDTGLAFSVDTEFNFDAQLQGRLLIPYSLQEGVPTEIGFQAQVDNQGLHAEVVTEIGADAVLTRREAVPTIGAIEVDVDGQLGGMMIFDYQSPDRFKFAGLENTTEFGKRWVIGQFELVEAGGSSGNVGSSEPRWTVLANGNAEELAGVSGMIRMRVEWNGGQVRVGRQLSTGGFNVQANYQFSSSFAGGLAGLAASTRSAQFQNYRVFAKQAASGTYVELAQDPLTSTPADPWQVERGVWRVENGILTGKPTEVRLGDWLLVSRARLAAELDVRFNQQDILGPPTSVAAEIGVSDLDALLYEVSDGGTPLYPDDPNSPEGLVAIEGGFGTLSTDGLALGAERFSAGIKDVVFLEIYDGKIDLAGGPNLLQAGGVGITVPFFGDEPFQIQDTNPDDDVPLLALKRPEIDAGQIVRDAAFAFGQAVGFDLPVGQGLDEFNLRDLLPLTVENVHLEFPDTNQLDTFKLSVDAQFNLYETDEDGNVVMQDGKPKKRGFFAALPFDPILAIGRPDQQSCSSGTVINWPEIDSNEFPDVQGLTLCENGFVQVEVEASSLLNPDRQLMFTELGPIFIGARNVPIPATSVAADGALYLGKFVNGSWDGDIAGTFTLRDTRPNENNSVRASAVGQISVSEGTTI